MNKAIMALVIILVAGGLVWFFVAGSDEAEEDTTTTADDSALVTEPADGVTPDEVMEYTPAEVATHNTEDDCWTYIGNKVYDLADYLPTHPGGDEILLACGTDGSSLFNERTTAEGEAVGSGTPHSDNASSQLELFEIGDLLTL